VLNSGVFAANHRGGSVVSCGRASRSRGKYSCYELLLVWNAGRAAARDLPVLCVILLLQINYVFIELLLFFEKQKNVDV
jgi:hypothetical protein